jgi:hypothetical protein
LLLPTPPPSSRTTINDLNLFYQTTYTLWDADKSFGCICDPGYTGYDCGLRDCIYGDDPRTTESGTGVYGLDTNEVQTISCTADGGSFTITYQGQATVVRWKPHNIALNLKPLSFPYIKCP